MIGRCWSGGGTSDVMEGFSYEVPGACLFIYLNCIISLPAQGHHMISLTLSGDI